MEFSVIWPFLLMLSVIKICKILMFSLLKKLTVIVKRC